MKAGTLTRGLLVLTVGVLSTLPWLFSPQRGLEHRPRATVQSPDTTPPGSPELERFLGVDPRALLLYDHQERRPELEIQHLRERMLNPEPERIDIAR
jgi:hypothetical protein